MSQQSSAPSGVSCAYCKGRMMEVVRGWHCPSCHATRGQQQPLAR